jgi:ATP-dependent DNA ligase
MKILYPPHPNIRIPFGKLREYEESGKWIAQRKFNGTNVLIYISKDRKVHILTRHGTPPKLFSLSKSHIDQILSLKLDPDKDYWLNGELLDHKTKNKDYKKKIVLFDVLHAGKYLIRNPNQQKRLEILSNICNNSEKLEKNGLALEVTQDIWMAESWEYDFEEHFKEHIDKDEIEGLILRKKNSFLDNFGQKEYDVSWIIKCRKPHAGGNYTF